eukprot:1145365-Pelagomonas_calceolata.AAC.2
MHCGQPCSSSSFCGDEWKLLLASWTGMTKGTVWGAQDEHVSNLSEAEVIFGIVMLFVSLAST